MIDGMLDILKEAPYGVYAMDMNQTILFWNRGAERILEYRSDHAVGRVCCEVMGGIEQEGPDALCAEGCPSIDFVRRGEVPPILHIEVLAASGRRKPVTLTPLIVKAEKIDESVLVSLFYEEPDADRAVRIASTVGDVLSGRTSQKSNSASPPAGSSVTDRELQVLQLAAYGLNYREIASEMALSPNTVRNHVSTARDKLESRTILAAVLAAQRLGLL